MARPVSARWTLRCDLLSRGVQMEETENCGLLIGIFDWERQGEHIAFTADREVY